MAEAHRLLVRRPHSLSTQCFVHFPPVHLTIHVFKGEEDRFDGLDVLSCVNGSIVYKLEYLYILLIEQ